MLHIGISFSPLVFTKCVAAVLLPQDPDTVTMNACSLSMRVDSIFRHSGLTVVPMRLLSLCLVKGGSIAFTWIPSSTCTGRSGCHSGASLPCPHGERESFHDNSIGFCSIPVRVHHHRCLPPRIGCSVEEQNSLGTVVR